MFRVTANDQDLVEPFVCLNAAMAGIWWGRPNQRGGLHVGSGWRWRVALVALSALRWPRRCPRPQGDILVEVVAPCVVWLSERAREAKHDIGYDLEILRLAALDYVFIRASEDAHLGLAVAIPGAEVCCSDDPDGLVGGNSESGAGLVEHHCYLPLAGLSAGERKPVDAPEVSHARRKPFDHVSVNRRAPVKAPVGTEISKRFMVGNLTQSLTCRSTGHIIVP